MRKRSAYRPKPICFDTMAFVKETLEPISTREECVTFQLRNHQALAALAKGHGMSHDIRVVIAALNVTEALARMDVGNDWADEIKAGQDALMAMTQRCLAGSDRYVFKAAELTAVNLAMEVHDAQLDAVNVGQMQEAIELVRLIKKSGAARAIA